MQENLDTDGGREDGDVELALFRKADLPSGSHYSSPLTLPNRNTTVLATADNSFSASDMSPNPLNDDRRTNSPGLIPSRDKESTFSGSPPKPQTPFAHYRTQFLSRYGATAAENALDPYRPPDTIAPPIRPFPTTTAAHVTLLKKSQSPSTSLNYLCTSPSQSAPSYVDAPECHLESLSTNISASSPELIHSDRNETSRKNISLSLARASLPYPPMGSDVAKNSRREFPSAYPSGGKLVPEENWREAITKVCADMLGKSLTELEHEFTAFGLSQGELAPRDLADYTIMSTLKTRDAFAMRNAPSWLFNTMDRSGAGFVLREEFVRYAPFMSPVADTAIASTVFDELIRAQVHVKAADEQGCRRRPKRDLQKSQAGFKMESNGLDALHEHVTSPVAQTFGALGSMNRWHDGRNCDMYPISGALCYDTWKQYFDAIRQKYSTRDDDWERVKKELGLDPSERLIKSQGAVDHSDLWPTLGKLYLSQRYLVFFAAVGRNHYVARLGAIANVGTRSLPLLMRDCITVHLESETQAAMNGLSAPIQDTKYALDSLGDTTRQVQRSDAIRKGQGHGNMIQRIRPRRVEEKATAGKEVPGGQSSSHSDMAIERGDGKLARNIPKKELTETTAEEKNEGRQQHVNDSINHEHGNGSGQGNDPTLPQHVVNVMKQFTAGGKPLVFSLIEFRETTRRDCWLIVIKEMAAAHRLHLKLGFGSLGRATLRGCDGVTEDSSLVSPERLTIDEVSFGGGEESPPQSSGDILEVFSGSHIVYLTSPFRNEPPPPLLAVAAHANIVRYRAIKMLSGSRNPTSLLVFSHPERHAGPVGWYVDAVRAHDSWAGRSWIERAMDAIRENIELNKRVYNVQDDEPFDVGRLGEGMGRLAQLCTPLVRAVQFFNYIVQWRNPPATILAFCVCLYVLIADWVPYLPAMALFSMSALIILTKAEFFGLDSWLWGRCGEIDPSERQANVLEIVSQVHETLRVTQNVIKQINQVLGKVQTLCLWNTDEEWQSWIAVAAIFMAGCFAMFANARLLYTMTVLFMFLKHFLPPDNPPRRFWVSIPAFVTELHVSEKKQSSVKHKVP